jgi:RluA family pseudouridine synthase
VKHEPLFSIVHQDDKIIVVNKTSGTPVSPDRYDRARKNLFDVLSEVINRRLWIVHRIDSGTSGLVVFAKTDRAHRFLSMSFENRTVQKKYITIVQGRPVWKEQSCDFALVPDGNKKHQTIVDKFRGKKSLTHFTALVSAGNYTVLEAVPETGRTHQIRVHAAALGHPVLCDPIYGTSRPICLSSFKKNWRGDPFDERPLLDRLALHAAELKLPDYGCGPKEFAAPLPRDMAALIKQMEKTGRVKTANNSESEI